MSGRLCAVLCVVLLVMPRLSPTVVAAADAVSDESRDAVQALDEYVVSHTRLPTMEKRSLYTMPSTVSVITADDIEKAGARTVQEAVQHSTGVVLYDQVGNDFEQTVDLRGFNGQPFPSTTVLVDGVRLNNPDTNTVNFDVIPVESIERIEIHPGSSAIVGKNALGGTINIWTKNGSVQHRQKIDTTVGSFQRQRLSFQTSGPLRKRMDYFASVSREIERGFRENSGARLSRVFVKTGYRPSARTTFSTSYAHANNRLYQAGSLPLSIATVNPRANFTNGDFHDRESHIMRINMSQALPHGFSLAVNGAYQRFQEEGQVVGQTSQINALSDIESWSGALQIASHAEMLGHSNDAVLGVEWARHDFGNNDRAFFFSFPDFPTLTTTSIDEDVLALYAQNTVTLWSTVIVTGGVRYDQDRFDFRNALQPEDNLSRRFHRVTPRAGVTYVLWPQTSVFFQYSRGFRVPTVSQLFTSRGEFGSSDPTLHPIKTTNYEVGINTRMGSYFVGSVAAFLTDVRDEIITSCSDTTCAPVASNRNIEKSRRRGFEVSGKGVFSDAFDGSLNYTFTEATFQSPVVTSPFYLMGRPFIETVDVGDSFPMVPRHRMSLVGNYHPWPDMTISLTGQYVSPRFLLGDLSNSKARLAGYFLMHASVSVVRPVAGGTLTGFLMIDNLTDATYFSQGIYAPNVVTGGGALEQFVVPGTPLTVYGGVSVEFEGL